MGTKESYTLTKSFAQFCSRLKVSKDNFSANPGSPRSCHCTTEFGGYGESGKPGDLMISSAVSLVCWAYLVLARHKQNKRLFLHIYYWIHCTIINMNVAVPKPPEPYDFCHAQIYNRTRHMNFISRAALTSSPYEYLIISVDKTHPPK